MCVFTHVNILLVSKLGEVMVSMASNLMLADERVLWMAQREAMACSRIIACLQKIAVYRLATAQVFSLVSQQHFGPYFFGGARSTQMVLYFPDHSTHKVPSRQLHSLCKLNNNTTPSAFSYRFVVLYVNFKPLCTI